MAAGTAAGHAWHALANGSDASSPEETEKLYDELLRLRDAIIAGQHRTLKLPSDVVDALKTSITLPHAPAQSAAAPKTNGAVNGSVHSANSTQLPQYSSSYAGLPGLGASPSTGKPSHALGATPSNPPGLDPIFLEKSPSLVRAEARLKRERIDRDLQAQVDQRKHAPREKDAGADHVDVEAILRQAQQLVKAVSGLKSAEAADQSSFDENDYYSSQVQSEWSSPASSKKGSDRAVDAFTADYEPLDGGAKPATTLPTGVSYGQAAAPSSSRVVSQAYADDDDDDVYEPEDGDDDYAPPDASAIDTSLGPIHAVAPGQSSGLDQDEDSDYEPGDIAAETQWTAPKCATHAPYEPAQPVPAQVPVIRNHLTHIVAPQPNRVSPLATAKGPSYELELVNGSPQVVQKPQKYPTYVPPSRASTASPSGNGMGGSAKKRKTKKRKRDNEPAGRAKRRRDRQPAADSTVPSYQQETYIKNEPVSPPPFSNVPDYPTNGGSLVPYQPAQVDLSTPTHSYQPQPRYEQPRSGLRYEYVESAAPPPATVRVTSPASSHRPMQRNTQDLRRVASLHYAQRPASPPRLGVYSPVGPYHTRTVSMTYGDSRYQDQAPEDVNDRSFYRVPPSPESPQYPRSERSRSPPRDQQFQDPYVEQPRLVEMMPPPAPPPRRVIVDQYGNRYMEAGPAPTATPSYLPRASVGPVETRMQPEMAYERAPSRIASVYAPSQQPPAHYEPIDARLAPPPPSTTRRAAPESQYDYIDANGTSMRGYSRRPEPEPPRYAPEPSSPRYQAVRSYDRMPPPPAAPSSNARQSAAPTYVQRSYSVLPDAPPSFDRQGSIAPVQYVRQNAPAAVRAASVMPGTGYRAVSQQGSQRVQSQAPPPPPPMHAQQQQSVRYVDQYGREVFPRELNEVQYQGGHER